MEIKIKKLNENAVVPKYAKFGDAGMDLTATSKNIDEFGNIVYGTSLAIEIPKGYVGLVFPRSSNSKKDLVLTNSVGVIDSGYRGEIMLKFKRLDVVLPLEHIEYEIGERVGQIIIMPYPQVNFVEVNELSESERGNGGFGSSGK